MDVHGARGPHEVQGSADMNRLGKEHLSDVSDEGDRVRARREHLGMDKKELATEAKVNRNTLSAIESGASFNRTTLAKIERALDRLELEGGVDSPPPPASRDEPKLIRFRLKNAEGQEIVVAEGPPENLAELEASVARLIREMRGDA